MDRRPPLPKTVYGKQKKKPRAADQRTPELDENKPAKKRRTLSPNSAPTTSVTSAKTATGKLLTAVQPLPKRRPPPLNDKSNVVDSPTLTPPSRRRAQSSILVRSISAPTNPSPQKSTSNETRHESKLSSRPSVWVDKESSRNGNHIAFETQVKDVEQGSGLGVRDQEVKLKQLRTKTMKKRKKEIVTEQQILADVTSAKDFIIGDRPESPHLLRLRSDDDDMDIAASEGPSISEFVPVPRPTTLLGLHLDNARRDVSFATAHAVSTPIGYPKRFFLNSKVNEDVLIESESGHAANDDDYDKHVDGDLMEAEGLSAGSPAKQTDDDNQHLDSDESDDPLINSVAEICHIPSYSETVRDHITSSATAAKAETRHGKKFLSSKWPDFGGYFMEERELDQTESNDELFETYDPD
ncbi:hypothetical protein BC938DRAFT_483799 [Jimgerdemannia flammicorona]|uniref:Uncharacterized protein n=1 Tax=Jimgerdemannia flammicorona TaxID=994334 RepID=A0A433QB78_9FUNG|nr:hypothetical protein BC938DRAFT_483799 [Jimgerdemannia flammicorona]